ncbi:hypothetical protein EXE53_27960, partial [Halorubrum sp. SD626R]|uniref:hypothetical protein n=1 Tax=Halorubrum sp. SD626R TaxID=1419722 RepID=UPI0010F624C1
MTTGDAERSPPSGDGTAEPPAFEPDAVPDLLAAGATAARHLSDRVGTGGEREGPTAVAPAANRS